MNWNDYKNQINSLDKAQMEQIEIVSQLIIRRKELKLTQKDVAEKAGLHQATIARMENEGAIPRLDTLEKVAKALGFKVALVDENAATTDSALRN